MAAYRSVRALERGVSVLSSLARHGPATPRAIAQRIGLDRATVYRLLETLAQTGLVAAAAGGRFRMTGQIRDLAAGYDPKDVLLSAIGPALYELQQAVLWPACYATLRDDVLVIEDSTLSISPYGAHKLKPGTEISVLRTSSGRAVLAGMKPEQREALIPRLLDRERQQGSYTYARRRVDEMLRSSEETGYAHNVGDLDASMSGFALPVMHHGVPIGSVAVLFFTKGLSVSAAAERYLDHLRRCIARLEGALALEEKRLGVTPQL